MKEKKIYASENFDEETSQEIQAVGAVTAVGGIAYCLLNADECANVTTTIASYETATKEIDDNLTRADETIATLNTDIERLTEKQNELQQSIDNIEETINYTQEKIEELRPIGLAKILNNL
ncbi:MAG: hypothetical protein KGV57_01830 [Fusobacterium sp.]|nr:hypothetical protein [Fusobacterium sp.]